MPFEAGEHKSDRPCPYCKQAGCVTYRVWESSSQLSKDEQTQVEIQRQSLWRHGIRRQPMLDRMAFEFGYVACLLRSASTAGPGENAGGDSG